MSEHVGVWGIEIGQAGLKAIRLRYAEAARQVIAVNFDYVPHPKILSQPDAIPEELVPQALETFLSRNDLAGDKVCISVPGQSALTRFIQLPPVESSRVAEIVKYEARQQIPFALEDVIWDYQNLGGGQEEGGFLLEAEVGLFAMKRDQVESQLRPFTDAKVEVELVQVAPLALYNMLGYDQLGVRIGEDQAGYEPGDEYTIVVDMGADNSTLLVSNGEKIWIRNVPVGGNHFTRALTKEMKLTFAKAEHLKCNATKSPDPRAVFQALRPVFNDYVSEIQRSIGYFSSVNREATIKKVLGVGNGFKLAGLQKFLQQNLQYEVERVESFNALVGDSVLDAPLFKENVLSFAVPYGLALQGLGVTRIHTTLLPPEIATARKIRRKKPWAVATAASLLFGLATSVAVGSGAWHSVSEDRWKDATTVAESAVGQVDTNKSAYQAAQQESEKLDQQDDQLVAMRQKQHQWPLLYKAINESLPRDKGAQKDEEEIAKRHRIKVTAITSRRVGDLETEWFEPLRQGVKESYLKDRDSAAPPSGPGYVVRIEGLHYHHNPKPKNPGKKEIGVFYVRDFFLDNLQSWLVEEGEPTKDVNAGTPARALGISHAMIVKSIPRRKGRFYEEGRHAARNRQQDSGFPGRPGFPGDAGDAVPRFEDVPGDEEDEAQDYQEILQTQFTIEFAWQPRDRDEMQKLLGLLDYRQATDSPTYEEAAEFVRSRGVHLTQEDYDRLLALLEPPKKDDTTQQQQSPTTPAAPPGEPSSGHSAE